MRFVRLRNMSIRHLKTRKQFQSMLAHPPIAKTSHFALHRAPVHSLLDAEGGSLLFANPPGSAKSSDAPWWVGALVPKRWAKHAVTRNLVRRNVYAITLELSRRAVSAAPALPCTASEASDADLQAAPAPTAAALQHAYLIRLRSSFHTANAGKQPARNKNSANSTRKAHSAKSQQASSKTKPLFISAASAPLKSEVRAQLLTLFARADEADARARIEAQAATATAAQPDNLSPAAALNPLKEAGQDA